MAFHLYSTGKLIEGADELLAIAAIARITNLTAAQVQEKLLSGKRRRLVSGDDEDKINKARDRLLAAGLAIEVVSDVAAKSQVSTEEAISTSRRKALHKPN